MKLSIVIPVYNEARALDACLQSIADQLDAPFEVIVVDNNSSDSSVSVASNYAFVRVLKENQQGVTHARNTGFNAASGEIIGRIDADTILPNDWTIKIMSIFNNSPDVAAVSGSPDYYDFALSNTANTIDYYLRNYLSKKLGNTNFLWGANMAIRRSAWRKVRSALCNEKYMHEDFDLAIHLQEQEHKVLYESSIIAGVSSRRIDTNFRSYLTYCKMSPRTYALHNLRSRIYMYPILVVCVSLYLPARLIYRGYDHEKGGFSVNKLFMNTQPRIDPTSNIV